MSILILPSDFYSFTEAAALMEGGAECKTQPADPNQPKPDPRIAEGQRIAAEVKADLDWVRGLDIKGNNGNFATEDNKIDGRNMLIQQIYNKYSGDPVRASRLLVALTLYGEFRSNQDGRPAHWLLATMVMENRARDGYQTDSPQLRNRAFDQNGRPLPGRVKEYLDKTETSPGGQWLKDKAGAAGFNPNTFTSWNSNDPNLVQILTLTDQNMTNKIGDFLGEYYSNQWAWTPPPEMPANLRYYDSPQSYPNGKPPAVSKLSFTPVTAPSNFFNHFTGCTSSVRPEACRVGVTKGGKPQGVVSPPAPPAER